MRDVCNLAGVSVMTVSRVLATPDKVSPKTRERVLRAIEQIGYVPDLNAGSLSSKRSRFVALILPTLTNSNFADMAAGLTEALAEHGYRPLIGYSNYGTAQEEELIRTMLARRPDAMVLVGAVHSKAATIMLHTSGIPIVETWDLPEHPLDVAIGHSNEGIGRLAAQHLISLGHKRIAGLSGRTDGAMRDFRGERRMSGFAEALRSAGLSDEWIIRAGDPPISFTEGAEAMRLLLQREPKGVDAVFAVSDLAAFGAIMECHRQGLSVPDDISIMGFGNFEVGAQTVPSITTISVDPVSIGRRTGEYLMDLLEPELPGALPQERRVDLGFKLIERASTAAAGRRE
ncbi:MAG: LacI family DNA-binding transcriptional regulator [Devosia sp.]